MGRERQARRLARANIDAWIDEIEGEGLDAILITTSGCGTTIKDYAHLFRHDRGLREEGGAGLGARARRDRISRAARPAAGQARLRPRSSPTTPPARCSTASASPTLPKALLKRAGFEVRDVPEGHICCGSAGTYNMLQPEIAARLRDRKVRNIEAVAPDVIATGNIGCITQIASGTIVPVLHTVELLDWAYGERAGGLPPRTADRRAAIAATAA